MLIFILIILWTFIWLISDLFQISIFDQEILNKKHSNLYFCPNVSGGVSRYVCLCNLDLCRTTRLHSIVRYYFKLCALFSLQSQNFLFQFKGISPFRTNYLIFKAGLKKKKEKTDKISMWLCSIETGNM